VESSEMVNMVAAARVPVVLAEKRAEEVAGRLEVALGGGQAKVVVARVVRAVLRVVAVVARAAVGRVEVWTASVRVGNQAGAKAVAERVGTQAGAKAVAERATVVAERAMVVAAKVMESLGAVTVGKEVEMMALVAVARTAAARVTRRLAQSSWLLC